MVTLKLPFEAPNMRLLVQKILRGRFSPITDNYSKELKDLIQDMLTVNPKARPSVMSILNRPFIRNRINNFLSEAAAQEELGHTIIHGKHAIRDAKDIMNQALIRDNSCQSLGSAPSDQKQQERNEAGIKRSTSEASSNSAAAAKPEMDRQVFAAKLNYEPVRAIQERLRQRHQDNRSRDSARSDKSKDGRYERPEKKVSNDRVQQPRAKPEIQRPGIRGGINAWRPSVARSVQSKQSSESNQSDRDKARERGHDNARQRAHERAIQMAKERAAERYRQAMEAREKSRQRAAEAEARRKQIEKDRVDENRRRKANLAAVKQRAGGKVDHSYVPNSARGKARASADNPSYPSNHRNRNAFRPGMQADPSLKVKPSRAGAAIRQRGSAQSVAVQGKPIRDSSSYQQAKQPERNVSESQAKQLYQRRKDQLRQDSVAKDTAPGNHRVESNVPSSSNRSKPYDRQRISRGDEENEKAYNAAVLREKQRNHEKDSRAWDVKGQRVGYSDNRADQRSARQDEHDGASNERRAGYLDQNGNIRLSKYALKAAREKLADRSQAERRQKVVAAADDINRKVGDVVEQVKRTNVGTTRDKNGDNSQERSSRSSRDRSNDDKRKGNFRVSPVLSPSQQKYAMENFDLGGADKMKPQQPAQSGDSAKKSRQPKREELWARIQEDRKKGQQQRNRDGPAIEIYAPTRASTTTQEAKPELSLDAVEEQGTAVENILKDHVDEHRVHSLLGDLQNSSEDESGTENTTPNFEPEYNAGENGSPMSTLSMSRSDMEESNENSQDDQTSEAAEEDETTAKEVKHAKEYNDYVDMLQTMHELDKTLTGVIKKRSPEETKDSEEESADWISSSDSETDEFFDKRESAEKEVSTGQEERKEGAYENRVEAVRATRQTNDQKRLKQRIKLLQDQLRERLGEDTFDTAHNVVLSEKPQQAAKTVMQLLGAHNIDALEQLLELCMLQTRAAE